MRGDMAWTEHLGLLERHHTSNAESGLEYNVVFRLMNAADYGVPQIRHRVVIVGFRNDLNVSWSFPEPTHSRLSGSGLKPWRTVRDALQGLPDPRSPEAKSYANHEYRDGARAYKGHSGSVLDKPSKAIKAGAHGVPGGENMLVLDDGSLRYYTVRESARIQTFPDDYSFIGSWTENMRQIGNAVPVRLARAIGDSVVNQLERAGLVLDGKSLHLTAPITSQTQHSPHSPRFPFLAPQAFAPRHSSRA